MRLTSQSALLHSRILNCWDLSATPQPRYQLRHDQNSNSILSRVDIVKIFIHCKNIRGCRVSCLLEHNWGAAECGLLLLLGCGEILIYLIANVATDTVTSRGRPALYHHLTLPQEPSINNVINVRYLQDSWQEKTLIVSYTMRAAPWLRHQEKDDVFYARPRQRPNHYQLSLNESRFLSSLLSLKVEFLVELLIKVREDFKSRRRPLLWPSPGWKCLLALY